MKWLLALLLLLPNAVMAVTYTVKPDGSGNYTTIAACSTAAVASDICDIYTGSYAGWTQATSGSAGAIITFQAHTGESVIVTSGINLSGRSYIHITGLNFTLTAAAGVTGDGTTNHNTIDFNTFTYTIFSSSSSVATCSDNVIAHNTLTFANANTNASGIVIRGDRNRIEYNTVSGGGGDFMTVGGSHVVIRYNTFSSSNAAISGEHIDFMQEAGSSTPVLSQSLIENNVEHDCVDATGNCHFVIIRTLAAGSADFNIIRYNFVQNIDGGAIGFSGPAAGDSTPNGHVYNNTLAIERTVAANGNCISLQDVNGATRNNICYNTTVGGWSPTFGGSGYLGNGNIAFTTGWSGIWISPYTLEATYASLKNVNPLFYNYPSSDELTDASPALNTGVALTTVHGTDTGTGTTLKVVDAGFFQAYGTSPDCISITNIYNRICITAVDYATNTITLASETARASGDPIWLYSNSRANVVVGRTGANIGSGQQQPSLASATPILPQRTVDTTYSLPVGGTTHAAHDAAGFITALSASVPGDVIVLDAGTTYSGNFTLPIKANPLNKWIYIISSDLASLPAGTRVTPASASHMPKLTTPGATTLFNMPNTIAGVSSNYWRLVGLELTTNSNYCPVATCPPNNYMTNGLIQQPFLGSDPPVSPQQHHLIIDRCYAHGDATHDIQGAIALNVSYGAIIDSEISEIHLKGTDSWAAGGNWGAGPFKIVNNMLSASSEDMIWGGSGLGALGNIPSDITVTGNYFFKPLSWIPLSVGNHSMVVKNAFECKSCQRVFFDSNIIENVWADGQLGWAFVMTVRPAQSGNIAVVNDITATNNVFINVARGVNTLGADDNCGIPPYTACTNAGSQARWNIYNNKFSFFDPTIPGGISNIGMAFQPGVDRYNNQLGMIHDVILQHNSFIDNPGHPCSSGVYINNPTSFPPAPHVTSNIWILDNVFCGLPDGPNGRTITALTNTYMPWPNTAPNSIQERFCGNVMAAQGGSLTWPACAVVAAPNLATNTSFVFNPDGTLNTPTYTTTVGPPPPPNISGWLTAGGSPVLLSVLVTPASATIPVSGTQQYTATANYSDGSNTNVTTTSAWVSDATGIATVGASTGLVTGVSVGTSNITATFGGLVGPAIITVTGTGNTQVLIRGNITMKGVIVK